MNVGSNPVAFITELKKIAKNHPGMVLKLCQIYKIVKIAKTNQSSFRVRWPSAF